MSHVHKLSEWQGGSGNWYCADTCDLGHGSGRWWITARMLDMTPAAYVKWLIDNYHPDNIKFNGETLIFSWNEHHYAQMHKYLLDINRIARNKNFII